jgi:hypothetical protein
MLEPGAAWQVKVGPVPSVDKGGEGTSEGWEAEGVNVQKAPGRARVGEKVQ